MSQQICLELRQDLELHPGPPAEDGGPGWVLHDAAAHRYYRLPAEEVEILAVLGAGGAPEIAAAASVRLRRPVPEDRVTSFISFLARHDLLAARGEAAAKRLGDKARMANRRNLAWLAKNYLFMRLPLLRPDRLLERALPYFGWWFHRRTNLVVFAMAVFGLLLVVRQWDNFVAAFPSPSDPGDLMWFGLGLFAVKAIHELSHALTAKQLGCRVPSLGVTLLVFVPVLYTDTSDTWRLTSRHARMQVAFAGIKAEIALASLGLLAWAFLPEGPVRGLAQAVATTNWLLTLTINLNPLMRFDGYFLLADAVGIDNLQPRAVALSRWWLIEALTKLGDPPPEPPRRWMIAYGMAVQAYRIGLTFAVALLVYALVFKLLGLLLITAHLSLFVALPLIKEAKALWGRRAEIPDTTRLRMAGVALALFVLAVTPWRSTITAPAMVKAAHTLEVYAPSDGRMAEPPPPHGTRVTAGQRVLRLDTPDLSGEIARLGSRVAALTWQVSIRGFDARLLSHNPVAEAELRSARARLDKLNDVAIQADITAPFDGVVADLRPGLSAGAWIGEGEPLLTLVDPMAWNVVAYVGEEELERIAPGMDASFRTPGDMILKAQVVAIDQTALRELDAPALASAHGGPLPTRQGENGSLLPQRALYRVHMVLAIRPEQIDGSGVAGTVSITGHTTSPFKRVFMRALGVFRREIGF